MTKVLILCFISLYARLVIGAGDSHMCIRDIQVSYTATERIPVEQYGEFMDLLMELDVPGEVKEVVGFLIN